MPLSGTQQYWQNQYEALKTQQLTNKSLVETLSAIPEEVRTQSQTDSLRLAQIQQIDVEIRLINLQESIDKQMADQITAIDKRLAVEPVGSFIHQQLVANRSALLQGQADLSALAGSWDIPTEGATTYVVGSYVYSNNGSVRPDGTTITGGALYLLGEIKDFVVGAGNGAATMAADLSNWFGGLDPQLQYEFCKSNYDVAGKVGSTLLPQALRLPGDLGKIAGSHLGKATDHGFEVGSEMCKMWLPKEQFGLTLSRLAGQELANDLLSGLPDVVEFSFGATIASRLVAETAAHDAITRTFTTNPAASASILVAAASEAYGDTLLDFGTDALSTWNAVAVDHVGTQVDLYRASGATTGHIPQVDWTPLGISYNESSTWDSDPVTNTLSVVTNTSPVPALQNGFDFDGLAEGIEQGWVIHTGTYEVSMPSSSVNGDGYWNTEASWIASDGWRPGNYNLAGPTIGDMIFGDFDFSDFDFTETAGIGNISQSSWSSIYIDPLVLDLDGDGVQLTDYGSAPVLFDIDHDGGTKELSGWVSAQDGILVHDLNANGVIDNISETLSEYYTGTAGTGGDSGTRPYAHGFAALASLDSNPDNVFNSSDAAWSALRVWVDADHDGVTDAGELKTFADLGITQINLAATTQSGLVLDGNEVLASGTFVQGGLTREAIAARFLANPNGHSFAASGTGSVVSTQGGGENGNGTEIPALSSYVAGSSAGETVDVAAKGVQNAYGNIGDDTLVGDGGNNWLAGGAGSDTFDAGAGDDVLLIDAEDLQANIDAGDGTDIVQVVGPNGVMLNLAQANVEIAQGGTGNDVFIGGGRSSVFVAAGAGDDVIIGGAANDALSGEDGDDLVDGGAGNDLMRGHRGRDRLLGGAGDDIVDGGLEDDYIAGGAGNDVLKGGQGDDVIHGGDGVDIAEYSGSFADYRLTFAEDGVWITDTRSGRDGKDFLSGVEKLNFADVSAIDLTLPNPLPVRDVISVLDRTSAHLIAKSQLLGNDLDFQGDALSITEVLEAVGGTASLTVGGDVLFTPDPAFKGVMSFKYRVSDSLGNPGATAIDLSTGQSAQMKAAVYLRTPDVPSDDLAPQQWYITDANVLPVWTDYSGKGISIGQFEPGGHYSVGPEVFDYRHPDLQANADPNWLAQGGLPQTFSQHATLVAGVMVAARNGEGAVGVAYDAKLSGHYIQGEGLTVDELESEITAALAQFKNYDVVNNSWGATTNFGINVLPTGTLETGILEAVEEGRDGLGTTIVFAAGNDRESGGNSNYNALTNNRAVITVGAINAPGDIGALVIGQKPFSNPGASILVSAPGSNIESTARLLMNDNGSVFGSDFEATQGTSFATPIVSGVVALMLEANPNLGYRDIQTILAMTAKKFDDPNGTDWVFNTAKNWNGGGMHTSHDYGFGKVDALAAVRLAETWYRTNTFANEQNVNASSGTLNVAIPDGASELTRTLTLGGGLTVEHAQVTLELNHQRWGDLIIKLVSPTGTESVLVNRPGKAPGSGSSDTGDATSGTLSFSFGTTHHRGEDSAGTWTLKVIDAATGQTGTLTNWKLDLYGSTTGSDDVYVYTNEFGTFGAGVRASLTDTNGGKDFLNASAVTSDSTINLNNGSTSTIAGKTFTVNGDIEFAFGGDGNDTLTGNSLVNRLQGGRGNDTLSGGGSLDYLDGGIGDDTLTGGTEMDLFVIREDVGATDTITDFTPGAVGEEIMLVGFDNLTDYTQLGVVQEGANTRVSLGSGQSILLLNIAPSQISEQNFTFFSDDAMLERYADYLTGATLYWGTAGAENGLLPNNLGDMRYFALAGDDVIGARTQHDLVDGGAGNDTMWGDYPGYTPVPGNDWMEGGAGNDTLVAGAGDDVLLGGSGGDNLQGEGGNDLLVGATGMDQLYGGDGADVLSGGAGDDYLSAGAGDDLLYVEGDVGTVNGTNFAFFGTRVGGSGADVFKVTAAGGGASGFSASGSQISMYNMIADFDPNQAGERIDLSEHAWIRGTQDLSITNWTINGTAFARISASNGSQSVYVNLRGVTASALTADHFVFAPSAPGIYGGAGNDALTGDAGGNTIDGGAGADAMTGRTGDDTYIVDNVGDTVAELPGGGFDTVNSSVSFTLPSNVENLLLTGTSNVDGTGNAERNRLTGNAGNNRLDGAGGADVMIGGVGNDIYVVDDQSDSVIEDAGAGVDLVESSVSYVLSAHVENLTLTGTAAVNATGNGAGNQLIGNAADNVLDGAAGADAMSGGDGNDTYFVDDAGDVVTEALDEGTDTVVSSISYTLGSNVENLSLAIGAANGTGNALDNRLVGNGAANTLTGLGGNDYLDGRGGADTLVGGAGDDTYVVDHAGDTVVELSAEGTDTVQASLSYVLGSNVENLLLTAAANLSGDGNSLDNVIVGNSGNNLLRGFGGNDTLVGGAGTDTLEGGDGNDTYVVADALDSVTEATNQGTDTVVSSVSYTLGANVENLTLSGFASINGTGNALDNVLAGNSGSNVLTGGEGSDTYVFNAGFGADEIVETDSSGTSFDVIQFGEGIQQSDMIVSRDASHLYIDIAGNGDGIKIRDWMAGSDHRVERVEFHGGAYVTAQQLEDMATLVVGTSGNDQIDGSSGSDVAQGQNGADELGDGSGGNDLLDGGGGDDVLTGGAGNDFLAGGAGNDTLYTGAGSNVIAFNSGGGVDTVFSAGGASNTLSLGGGIGYGDVSLSKDGDDLIVNTSANDRVVFKNWYAGGNQTSKLQFVHESSAEYDDESSDPLYNKKVQRFDFLGLVSQFDAALAQNPTLTSWAITNALLAYHLAGADDAALGGDLAYWYGRNDALSGMSLAAAQETIGASGFGSDAQSLRPFAGLQEGFAKLA